MADPVPLKEQISEVKRELFMRAEVYPRLVANGKLLAQDADRQTMRMRAVLDTLMREDARERLL